MLSSPNKFYTPQGNPLDEEAKKAKQTLIQLLDKKFETIVGSPDEEMVKSCIKILIKNLHKLPWFQGRVIESLNAEFVSACQIWEMCHTNHKSNIAFEVQQGDNLKVLQEWQEQDMEIESKLETVEADILRLKAELREKELTRESLVKEKSDLFNQSKMSIDEAEKLLQEIVTVKLQSDVAVDNMKELAAKWERIRDDFKLKQVLMVRLESDLAQVLLAACKGELNSVTLDWAPGSAMVVVMASNGYPGNYSKGSKIQNLEEAGVAAPCVGIFHAGTALDADGNFVAMGGRILGITAMGKDLEEARDRAYRAVEEIKWEGGFYRKDIGWRALPVKQKSSK